MIYDWLIDETVSHLEDPKHAREYTEEMDRLLVEPILGITSEERLGEFESESFEKMLGMMGG